MDDLPQTQTQEEYVESSQEPEIIRPWGRLCSCLRTLASIDLVDPRFTFGRAPNCTMCIERQHFSLVLNVSKHHFKIQKEDEVVFITDLSKNGTFINEEKIGKNKRHIIKNGDIIAVGHPNSRVYCFSYLAMESFNYPEEMTKYFICKRIGRGAFGEVHLAYDKRTFEKFAIKRIDKARSSCSIQGHLTPPEKIKTEVEILSSFSHTFIIQMKEVFESDREVFLVLEYMPGGELTRRILSSTPLPEAEVKFIFYQILQAVRYLHLNGVTHRDLKPENVLLFSDTTYPLIKVSDFGLSKILDGTSMMATVCGTISYAAPEILNSCEQYNKKVDIWSSGVILFYMLSRTLPFRGHDQDSTALQIRAGKIGWDSKTWKGISNSAKDLTRKMLTVDSETRISTGDIFKHDWIEKDAGMKYGVEQLMTRTFEESESSEDTFLLVKRARMSRTDDELL